MENTPLNLIQASILFQNAGFAINQKVLNEINQLEHFEIQQLSNKAQELFIISKTMLANAVVEIGDEAIASFNSLETATSQINNAIKKIGHVQDIIELAATLVSTASALLTGNIPGIITNSKDVLDKVTNLLNKG